MIGKEIQPSGERYVSLYRRYRPMRFGEVIGQDAAVSVLRHSLEGGKTVHAYLFSGPRGCGKTSLARILAKALNCTDTRTGAEPCGICPSCLAITTGNSLDVVEIDGASNRGIDEVRELKAHVSLAPFSSKKKVYIVDEVHMLTEPAFNALLKTLEEPPSHAVFILATTEPQKVPVTIRSRCQHIPFRRIPGKDIASRLSLVCDNEGVPSEEAALWELARQADGAMRDALSLLEQAIPVGSGSVTVDSVRALVGGGSRAEMEHFVAKFRTDPEGAVGTLMESLQKGASMERLVESLFLIFRDLWILRSWGEKTLEGLELSGEEKAFLLEETPFWSLEGLRFCLESLSKMLGRLRLGIRTDVLAGLLLQGICPAQPAREQKKAAVERSLQTAGGSGPQGPVLTVPEKKTLLEPPRPLPAEKAGEGLPVTADHEAVRCFWSDFMESQDPADRQVLSALSGASVRTEGNGIVVDFGEKDRVGFELIRLERNLRQFTAAKERSLGSLHVTFCCKGECIRAEGAAIPDPAPVREAPITAPWDRHKTHIGKAENDRTGPEAMEGVDPSSGDQGASAIDEMLGWFGGEVLLVREEEPEVGPAGLDEGSAPE
jgi:DNA polymerase-3 subunit gamma/tau